MNSTLHPGRSPAARLGPFLVGAAVMTVLYGALLRFDAITLKYGPVATPAWLRSVQETRTPVSRLRPALLYWEPVPDYPHADGKATKYISDPYTYLQYAREMRSFYDAHMREPLFPYATKVSLALLDQQDVAVSFASAAFSVLAIVATLLLGWHAFAPWVGLGAALALAIEHDAISWGTGGWRDDAFMCAVVLSAFVMLRYVRTPTSRHAIVLGAVAGLACLIRITALSFIGPGFLFVMVTANAPWSRRASHLGLAVLVTAVIVGPYLINCWRAFGDPLYAINVHADVYRAADGTELDSGGTAAAFLTSRLRHRPIDTLDTLVLGLTSYPFQKKWTGFSPWHPSLGRWLSWAALAGLVLFARSSAGRLMLLVLATSLIPFAPTWRLISDWRFTEHAYPFFLIAAGFACSQAIALGRHVRRDGLRFRPGRSDGPAWLLLLAGIAVAWWLMTRHVPPLVVGEALRVGDPATIVVGDRDAAFFTEGWTRPVADGNVTFRIATRPRAVVRTPLPVRDHTLLVRLDPFPRPRDQSPGALPTVRLSLNERLAATIPLLWNPARVGTYEVALPAAFVKEGLNDLVFETDTTGGTARGIRLWYVRLTPH